jgi:hypothetical protein
MVSDSWEAFKVGFARLLGGVDTGASSAVSESVEEELEKSRSALHVDSPEELAASQIPEIAHWTTRLSLLMDRNPAAIDQLSSLVREIQDQLGHEDRARVVVQNVKAERDSYTAGKNQYFGRAGG